MALEAEDGEAIRRRSGTRGACLITLEKAQQDLPILIGRALAGEEIVIEAPGLAAVKLELLELSSRSPRRTHDRTRVLRAAE
jgi:hypothetical protein